MQDWLSRIGYRVPDLPCAFKKRTQRKGLEPRLIIIITMIHTWYREADQLSRGEVGQQLLSSEEKESRALLQNWVPLTRTG